VYEVRDDCQEAPFIWMEESMHGDPRVKCRLGWCVVAWSALVLGLSACVEAEREQSHLEYGAGGTVSEATDPIAFTDQPYDFTGDASIASLRNLISPFESVWYGFPTGVEYPVEGDCDPERDFDETTPDYLDELPAVIEGVVTLHPRYFMKVSVCGTEERYYGSYIIQDGSAGIHVLKDSRVAEFDIGDRVRLRVRALMRNFGTRAVLAFDQEEVLTTPATREAVYYEAIERNFIEQTDLYEVRRITGRVVLEATNQNFNEMEVRPEGVVGVRWLVSLDRELGTRGVAPPAGALVELTGPIIESFGLRMVISNLGQIRVIEG
jgi:hypothetical protein